MFIYRIIASLFTFLLLASPAWAEIPQLYAGADIDYAPFSFAGKDNEQQGFDIQFFSLLARKLGYEPEIVLDNWNEILNDARSGNVDCVLSTVYSQEREEYLTFSVPYNSIQLALVVPKNSDLVNMADLAGKEMAGLKNDAVPRIYLQRNNIPVTVISYETLSEALKQLNNGNHDFAIIPVPFLQSFSGKRAFDNLRIANPYLSTLTYRIGLTKGNEYLLNEINGQIKSLLQSAEYARLQEKWLFNEKDFDNTAETTLSRPYLLIIILGILLLLGFFLFHFIIKKHYASSL